jgi:uncharacterized protein YndB with AHSA1/START domain
MKVVCALVLFALPAFGGVKSAAPANLEIETQVEVDAAPAKVFRALGEVAKWWNDEHTFSGSSRNLTLEVKAGGCFCESWKDNGVQHGTVIQWKRNELVRLRSALGPLLELPVDGVLTFAIAADSTKSKLTLTYRVGGSAELALDKLAPIVDRVLSEQLMRLKAHAEGDLKNSLGTPRGLSSDAGQ